MCSFVGLPCNSSLTCLPNSPINKPPLQVSPMGTLRREMSTTRAIFFISVGVRKKQGLSSLSVPDKGAPPYFPDGVPMERDVRLQSLLIHISQDPTERALQIITCSSQVSGKWAPPPPPGTPAEPPMERHVHFQSLILHISLPRKKESLVRLTDSILSRSRL